MKGLTIERDSIIKVLLAIFTLLIIFGFIVFFILPNIGNVSAKVYITQLCPDWTKEGCSAESAGIIKIKVNNEDVSLAQLCTKEYNVDESDFNDIWENCKKLCMGCPK